MPGPPVAVLLYKLNVLGWWLTSNIEVLALSGGYVKVVFFW